MHKMKKRFSAKWKSSTKPRKQVKYRKNAPKHLRQKMLSAHLNTALKKRYGRRSFPIKKGDEIKVMKGKFKGKSGKIILIDTAKLKVQVDGLQRGKVDGSKVNIPLDPSNLLLTKLDLEDKKRMEAISKARK